MKSFEILKSGLQKHAFEEMEEIGRHCSQLGSQVGNSQIPTDK